MGLQSLMAQLRCPAPDTPETPEVSDRVSAKPAPVLGCTRDTPETPELVKRDAVNDAPAPMIDPDRLCWPHSDAMNTGEIDTFTARLARFTDRGFSLLEVETLADKLLIRDRELDDRRLCLECLHLSRGSGWRCGNWQRAGVAIRARDARLPIDFVTLLQRCDGFKNSYWPTTIPSALCESSERPKP
ncbi:MAG: hypothetical protein ABI040_08125 [Rhodoferax sp.]